LHLDDQIDPCQIVECEMNKQDQSESFVIEVYVVFKGAHEISMGFQLVSILFVEAKMIMGNLQARILAHLVHHCLLKKSMIR
jgi:hypothetical protein